MNEQPPITSGLHAAIVAVTGEIRRLEKAGDNTFDKYHFTSIDDFKDHIRPLLAKHGLYVSISEDSFETVLHKNSKGEEKTQLKITYSIWLTYKDGAETRPVKSTILLPYTGAQATGIAESYVIKKWAKSQFLASSGDTTEEADAREQDEFVEVLTRKEANPIFEALQKELREVSLERDSSSMLKWSADNRSLYMSMPPDFRKYIKEEYDRTLTEIMANENLDGKK